MNKYLSNIKAEFNDNFFFKTCSLVALPILIIVVFLIFSTFSFSRNYKDLLKSSYLERLESTCIQTETDLQNINSLVHLLSDNNELTQAATRNELIAGKTALSVRRTLTQLKDSNPLIDSICIYNRSAATVYANDGVFHATTYFSSYYHYAQYYKTFWDNYTAPSTGANLLSPTIVSNSDVQKNIIPVIFPYPENNASNSFLLVNISLTNIINNANNSKLTENSDFIVLNRENRNIFSKTNNLSSSLGDMFYTLISEDQAASFDCTVNNAQSLVIAYTPHTSKLGYSYIAIIPYSDIDNSTSKITYFLLFVGILALIVSAIGIYFSAKQIYTPIKGLSAMFSKKSEESPQKHNTIQELHSSIKTMLDTNSSLYAEYAKTLPLIQERYLIDLLNSNEHYNIDESPSDSPVDFKYDYFCSVVIKLKPTEEFYNLYNNVEYTAIKAGINHIIETEFAEKYDIYIIPSETDTLYVLLNLENSGEGENISKIIEKIQSIMEYDKSYMTVKIGVGNIYKNLSGLKTSHHEAINSISNVIGLAHIKISDGSENKVQTYQFGINDENILLNQLILGHIEDVKTTINEILAKNIQQNISDTAIIQLYVQILNVIFKVMQMKKIDYDPDKRGAFQIITEIITLPIPEVHNTVLGYLDILGSHTNTTSSKIDIQEIISYIQENQNAELSLEIIAEKFNTTPKYISKLIKEKLGVNFIDYLARLRITTAKQLLIDTTQSISEIGEASGFNNHSTFVRTFKKNTGLTPTEYRKAKKAL